MKLLSLNKLFSFLILILITSFSVVAEEAIDIWKKDTSKQDTKKLIEKDSIKKKIEKNNFDDQVNKSNIQIANTISSSTLETKIYGIKDPDENNFTLDMWKNTDGKEIKNTIARINKLKLSKSAENLLINTLMSYSYSPKNMSDEEFLNIKINWLMKNNKDEVLEEFLNKNDSFYNKKKVIQYLVDKNIAKANLKEGCEKVNYISKDIKDSYLEKFKIYCLIFNDKKNQAQLLFDILREQKLSNNFFNDKINFLLGIKDRTDQKIKDDNLLNFYLSSITVDSFKYEPNSKTSKVIWEYLNSANLIQIEDIGNKEKISSLEIAANKGTLDKSKIYEIYSKKPFDLNSLINAENIHQNLDGIDSRSLIYQKFLLSDNVENKINLLILLDNLFKKDKLTNINKKFMSEQLKELNFDDIPDEYKNFVKKNIISEIEYMLGRIKYDDKILHRSRVLRFYTEKNTSKQKAQKDLDNIFKKIKKNKKYFFSAKDLVLVEALEVDGLKIPKEIKHREISKKYDIPKSLRDLVEKGEVGLLALKFVEIIGEDKLSNLGPETVYFITNILNKAGLLQFRNEVIISSLPSRT